MKGFIKVEYTIMYYQNIFGHRWLEPATEFLEDKFKMAAEMSFLRCCQKIGLSLLLLHKRKGTSSQKINFIKTIIAIIIFLFTYIYHILYHVYKVKIVPFISLYRTEK